MSLSKIKTDKIKYFVYLVLFSDISTFMDYLIPKSENFDVITCLHLQIKCIVGHFHIKFMVGNSTIKCIAGYFAINKICWSFYYEKCNFILSIGWGIYYLPIAGRLTGIPGQREPENNSSSTLIKASNFLNRSRFILSPCQGKENKVIRLEGFISLTRGISC